MCKRGLLLFIALATLICPLLAWADLVMGVFPRRPAKATMAAFTPLVQRMEEALGEPVKLRVYKNFSTFWQAVETGKVDIVHYNQYHYLLSKKFGYEVIAANVEFDSPDIAGAITVRKDSGINKVEDLRGKTILFGGGRKAMGSFIATTAILKKHGLKAGEDYTVKFAKNPPSAVIGVYSRGADAAGSGDVFLKKGGMKGAIDFSEIKVLEKSDRFIHLPWAVKTDISSKKRKLIQKVLISLQDTVGGASILKTAKVNRFQPVIDSDFNKVREIVEYAIGQKL